MDEELVALYSKKLREEKKTMKELEEKTENHLLKYNKQDVFNNITAKGYFKDEEEFTKNKKEIEKTAIRITTWDEAREIAMDWKGDKDED